MNDADAKVFHKIEKKLKPQVKEHKDESTSHPMKKQTNVIKDNSGKDDEWESF
jgi:hypothetical protein